jgi:tetratricopeptide (TPR) repeat protein
MKKQLLIVGLWVCSGMLCQPVQAQSVDKANEEYKTFVRLNNENGDKGTLYSTLYSCYKEYVAVLNSLKPGNPSYDQAKSALRDIYPYLQQGAIYNSQKGSQQNALLLAQAYIDVPLMEAFRTETFPKDNYYPTMVYFAASGTFNIKDYEKAIVYFQEYLRTGEQKNRKDVFTYMAKACTNIKNYALAKTVLDEAVNNYPSDFNLLSMGINCCIDLKDNEGLQKYVSKALAIKPDDTTLLNIQGKLYEDTQEYQKALQTYTILRNANPRSLEIYKHLGLNYYNLGVLFNNKSAMEKNPSAAKKLSKQSEEYFSAAVSIFKDVLSSDPTSLKYMEALATAYYCLGKTSDLNSLNNKISSLGGNAVSASSIPSLMAFSDDNKSVPASATATNYNTQLFATPSTNAEEIPEYPKFAQSYVEEKIKAWQAKDPYETVDEYKARVTEATRDTKVKELLAEAEKKYISTYTQGIRFSDMQLKPYDADNRAFLIESKFGELIVPVPRENNEARIFESSWKGMQFKEPQFCINNGQLALASLTFVTPTGNTYRYDNKEAVNYAATTVDVRFDAIDYGSLAQAGTSETPVSRVQKNEIKVGSSDVDINIPEVRTNNDKTFAVIISNENYTMVSKVPMALNDGETFSRYCEKTLGMPKDNIRFYPDASYGTMLRAMRDIKDISNAYSGQIKVIFYYAGHGIPNEATKDAFLLPIDADGQQTEGCYSLNKLYTELGGLNANYVVVFLDACFSGAQRDGGMLASARGVALKAKQEDPKGNMVIFSAASGDETAFPYKDKGHELFTYFLLKKLQESKGNATLKDLGDYLTEKVKQQSVVVNRKVQTPTVSPSATLSSSWKELKLKP